MPLGRLQEEVFADHWHVDFDIAGFTAVHGESYVYEPE